MTVEIFPYDRTRHGPKDVSAQNRCGQGGRDTCEVSPVFSVVGTNPNYKVATCDSHVAGALRQALGMPERKPTGSDHPS